MLRFLKNFFALMLLFALCGYATWQKMEILAIISMFSVLALLFKRRTLTMLNLTIELLKSAKQAKFGNLELQLDKKLQDISTLLVKRAAWIQILLSQLSSDEIGLLLNTSKAKKLVITSDRMREQLRILRNRGLILHDKPAISNSTQAWLSDLGKELVSALLESSMTFDGQRENSK